MPKQKFINFLIIFSSIPRCDIHIEKLIKLLYDELFIRDIYLSLEPKGEMLRRLNVLYKPFRVRITGRAFRAPANRTPCRKLAAASGSSSPNYFLYNILTVNAFATEGEIKAAYVEQCKKFHPDTKNGNAMKFQEIIQGRLLLKDESTRKEYDSLDQEQYNEFMKNWAEKFRSADIEMKVDKKREPIKPVHQPNYDPPRNNSNTGRVALGGNRIMFAYCMGSVISFCIFFIRVVGGYLNISESLIFSIIWPLVVVVCIVTLIYERR